jgi:polyhydroxyalkanoate synthesis regulator protein
MGRTPWSMLNEMTERNMDMWKSMQQGFLTDAVNKARQGEDPGKPKKENKS